MTEAGETPSRRRLPTLAARILVPVLAIYVACFVLFGALTVDSATSEVEASRRREMALAASVLARPGFPVTYDALQSVASAWHVNVAIVRRESGVARATLGDDLAVDLNTWWHDLELDAPSAPELANAQIATVALGGIAHRVYWRWRDDPRAADVGPALPAAADDHEAVIVLLSTADIDAAKRDAALPAALLALVGLLATGGVALWLARSVVRPVSQLAERVQRVGAGEWASDAEGDESAPTAALPGSQELADLTASFDRMVVSLRQSRDALINAERLATLGRMAAHLAHEIRGPLAGIRLNLDCLKPALDREDDRAALADIADELGRLEGISAELLGAFREAATESFVPVVLPELVVQACRLLEPQLRHLGVTLETRLPAGDGSNALTIEGAPGPLKQVVYNLVMNAGEACAPRGSGSVVVSLELEPAGGTPMLLVRDDGPGIAVEVRDHLFEPFVTTRRAGGGTGLGLAIVKGVLDHHGAKIDVDTGDTGTVITIRFTSSRAATTDDHGQT